MDDFIDERQRIMDHTMATARQVGAVCAVLIGRLVRAQLRATGCERFELSIRRDAGDMILREGQGVVDIEEAIKWLRHENAQGAHQ